VTRSTKFGASLLAFLLFGVPVLTCALFAQAMTAAEKECCRKMAGECGRAGMARSHSCCQPNGSVDNRPIVKSASRTAIPFTLAVAHVIQQAELKAPFAAALTIWTNRVHGPPGETPPDTTVLRI
jgi:hypothetical protein